jgi:flagellar M-ring protein FliF
MSGFTAGQRSVVVVVGLAVVIGAIALSRWVAQPSWTPLYGNLSGTDASAVVEQLNTDGVPYKLTDGGATVLVPQSQVYDVRVALSGKGLPSGDGQNGWSLLDKQGITATDFQQNVAYRRALEGELANTLGAITGVRTAIVHLAIPKRDVFSSDKDAPTASVLLSLQAGTTLDGEQVRAITHLVSGSVENLDPSQVTVTDQTGKLLSASSDGAAGAAAAAGQADAQTAQYETRLSAEVQRVLDQVVGAGHSVVRVNAQLDFSNTESTSERFVAPSPTAPPQSEATVSEKYSGGGSGAGGTLGQILPSAAAGAAGSGAYQRDQRTVNNSIDKVVEKSVKAPGSVQRMTVAVVLDTKTAGTLNTSQVQTLVANAVGLDPKRGDSVQVDALPFDATAGAAAAKELAAAQKSEQTAQYLELGKKAGLGLLVLIVLFLMSRRRKKANAARITATASDLPPGTGMVLSAEALEGGEQFALPQKLEPNKEQMRDDVAALVESQPDDVARMLTGWLEERRA